MIYDMIDAVKENLRLTQLYCEMQMANSSHGPEAILRSINPEFENGQPLFYYSTASTWRLVQWLKNPFEDKKGILIGDTFDYQMDFKREEERHFALQEVDKEGKILAFMMDWNLFDGAATDETEGFLDDYSCPPIDTWFHLFSTAEGPILLAWIPAPFVDLIYEGIEVNMEKCIQWLNISHPDIHDQLINA